MFPKEIKRWEGEETMTKGMGGSHQRQMNAEHRSLALGSLCPPSRELSRKGGWFLPTSHRDRLMKPLVQSATPCDGKIYRPETR